MYLRIAVGLMAVVLAGCGTRSFVVPVGNDTFAMKGSSATLTSGAQEKARLVKHADDYCKRSGKSAVIVASHASDATHGTLAAPGSMTRAEVEFKCQ